jgi:ATP-dependent Clp protease adaptor protein ClpS
LSAGLIATKWRERFIFFIFDVDIIMNTSGQEQVLIEVLEAIETTEVRDLVVFNDDVNTFDHVIETLIKVCKHSPEQAEQCTLLIHFRGKCTVKTGSFDELRPMKDGICEAGIDAKIL